MATKKKADPTAELDKEGKITTPEPGELEKCVLTTSLGTEYRSYTAGEIYEATPETVQRLIDRGMAKPVET